MKRNTKFFSKSLIISTIALPIASTTLGCLVSLASCSKPKVKSTKFTVTANADSKLEYKLVGLTTTPDIQYSLDNGTNWIKLNKDDTLDIPKGSQLLLKGNNPNGISAGEMSYANLKFTGDVSLSGSIMKLLGDDVEIKSNFAFTKLFLDSTGITSIDEDFLPSTKLSDFCYGYLFSGCSSLKYAPKLPATTLTSQCYTFMFERCTSLQEIPQLTAKTLNYQCYMGMFQQCTSLQKITSNLLKFDETDAECCSYMFSECNNLYEIDDAIFPQNNISPLCYSFMFSKCTSLTSAPKIINDTLASGCYGRMFDGCTMLSVIPQELLNATKLSDQCYMGMFADCDNLSDITLTLPATKTYSECYANMFQGCSNLTQIPSIKATVLAPYCFNEMFADCTALTDLSDIKLEYEDASPACFRAMFASCTNITKLPTLKITNLAKQCFEAMFHNCEKITSIPNNYLPNTTLAEHCYNQMFSGTGITSIPSNLLSSMQLKTGCYSLMFANCYQLTSIPNNLLPATELAEGCYESMFSECTSLTTVSNLLLPAQEMKELCYSAMFQSCTQLIDQPNLQNITTLAKQCFQNMFGSTAIVSIQAMPWTQLADQCYDSMYYHCTKITDLSSLVLPATEIPTGAYAGMFQGCEGLLTPPDLTAITSIENDGLNNMLADCTKLNIQKGSGTKLFFTCPNIEGKTRAVEGMFRRTAGYKLDPVAGEKFYY